MNKLKEQNTEVTEKPTEKVVEKKTSTKNPAKELVKILNGEVFTKETIMDFLPFVAFLSLLAILYISNTFYAEKTIRKINSLTNELKELKAESITARSDRMFKSKQSEVAKEADKIGLKESVEPPIKLIADTQ